MKSRWTKLVSVSMCHSTAYLILFLLFIAILPHPANARIAGKVAFSVEHEGGLQILDPATGEFKALDVGMLSIGDLAYNRNRQLLIFEGSKDHEIPKAIYTYDFKSSKINRIFKPSSYEDELYRSEVGPGGDYMFSLNYDLGIFRYSFDNGKWEKVEVTDTAETNFQGISISRSGKRVALSPGPFNGFLLGYLDGTHIRIEKHILADFDSCTSPRWIGDDVIVFLGRKKAGYQYLWKMTLATGDVEQLTHKPLGTRDFMDISSDGKTIVFTATDSLYDWRLWKIQIDGKGLEPLTKTGQGHLYPVWIE